MKKFNSIEEVEAFKKEHANALDTIIATAENKENVAYAELWLCKEGSWVVSYDEDDNEIKREVLKEIYSYKNTTSQAGLPKDELISVNNIDTVKCWFNYYGNPSYVFHMFNGDTHLLVDDYGAMNNIRLSRTVVNRKKDMFIKW